MKNNIKKKLNDRLQIFIHNKFIVKFEKRFLFFFVENTMQKYGLTSLGSRSSPELRVRILLSKSIGRSNFIQRL